MIIKDVWYISKGNSILGKVFLVDVCDILEVMNFLNDVFYRKLFFKR